MARAGLATRSNLGGLQALGSEGLRGHRVKANGPFATGIIKAFPRRALKERLCDTLPILTGWRQETLVLGLNGP